MTCVFGSLHGAARRELATADTARHHRAANSTIFVNPAERRLGLHFGVGPCSSPRLAGAVLLRGDGDSIFCNRPGHGAVHAGAPWVQTRGAQALGIGPAGCGSIHTKGNVS